VEYSTVTAGKITGSVRVALGNMRPVSLKVGQAEISTISQNRRDPEGPQETILKVLLAAAEGGLEPVATVMNYACHATVLEHDNMLYSADFPGVAAALVEHAVGGKAIYMQGTCGDINPAWMRHDFEEIRRVGGIVGAAATRTAHELRPLGQKQSVINLSWNEELPVQPAPGTVISDISLGATRTFLDLPRKQLPELAEIEADIAAAEARLAALAPGDVSGRRAIRPRLNELRIDRATRERFPSTEPTTRRVEVQAFRISSQLAVAMLPGEFFVVTGRAIARRSPFEHTFVCAYANDYAGYFATAEQFPCGGYEVGSSRFQPEAESRIVDAAVGLLASLNQGGTS